MAQTDMWNPEQYKKFESERSRPFWDLTKMVNFDNVYSLLDVGCGSGQLTQALHLAHQLQRSVGIDSSPNMLAPSRACATRGLMFECMSVLDYMPSEKFDLVLSNAALQWIENQNEVFARLVGWLNPGGTLAVQVPVNSDHPSHTIAESVAKQFGLQARNSPLLPPETYACLLWDAGMSDIRVETKIYLHPMGSVLDVVEWTKGTLLTHYQSQLSAPRYEEFLREYTRSLQAMFGSGKYLYTFKRLFLVAKNA